MPLFRKFDILGFGVALTTAMRTTKLNRHEVHMDAVQGYFLVTFGTVGVLTLDRKGYSAGFRHFDHTSAIFW